MWADSAKLSPLDRGYGVGSSPFRRLIDDPMSTLGVDLSRQHIDSTTACSVIGKRTYARIFVETTSSFLLERLPDLPERFPSVTRRRPCVEWRRRVRLAETGGRVSSCCSGKLDGYQGNCPRRICESDPSSRFFNLTTPILPGQLQWLSTKSRKTTKS